MLSSTHTEFSQELDAAFADFLALGSFGYVEGSQSSIYAKALYASQTCLLRFWLDTHMGYEWAVEIARQPKDGQKPNWIHVRSLYWFLANQSPQEVFDWWIERFDSSEPQPPPREFAEFIRPLNTQITKFFNPRGFKNRYEAYEKHTKWRNAEFTRISDEYFKTHKIKIFSGRRSKR